MKYLEAPEVGLSRTTDVPRPLFSFSYSRGADRDARRIPKMFPPNIISGASGCARRYHAGKNMPATPTRSSAHYQSHRSASPRTPLSWRSTCGAGAGDETAERGTVSKQRGGGSIISAAAPEGR